MLLGASGQAWAQSADLLVNQTHAPASVPAGGVVTYTVRIDNNGPGAATAVSLTDTLPPGATFVSATSSVGTCGAPAGGSFSCALGSLAAGGVATVAVQVRLPSAGVWLNTATVSSPTPDNNANNNTNANQATAVNAANLRLTASSSPATVVSGANYTYTLNVANLGPNDLPAGQSTTVSIPVPAGAVINSLPSGTGWTCTPTTGYPMSSGTVSCTRSTGLTTAGATASFPAITVSAKANVTGTVTAAFSVASTFPDGDATNNTATVSITATAGTDMGITKTRSPTGAVIAQGTNVTYALSPSYVGGTPPTSVTVTDPLPPGLDFVSAGSTTAAWGCSFDNATRIVTCARNTQMPSAPGGMGTINIVGTVNATGVAAGQVSNTASIATPVNDPVPGNNSSAVTFSASNTADLRLTKTPSSGRVPVGTNYSFTIGVTNLGPTATVAGQTITVTEAIPAGMRVRSRPTGAGWSCAPAGVYPINGPTTITCTRTSTATVAVNGVLGSITVPVVNTDVNNPTPNNSACVALGGAGRVDGNAANNCVTTGTGPNTPQADLSIVKTASGTVLAGQNLTYTMTVANAGPDAAANVIVDDALAALVAPGGVQSVTTTQGTCSSPSPVPTTTATSATLTCNLGSLGASATATVTVTVRPANTTATALTRSNTATVRSDTIDPGTTNNSSTASSTGDSAADVSVAKTASPSPVAAGAPLTYVATVRNNGPSPAAGVTLTDTLPTNAAFIDVVNVTGGGACGTQPAAGATGGTLGCAWPANIPSGTQYTVTYRVRPLGTAAGGNVVNTVSVSATNDRNTANNTTSTTVPVNPVQLDVLVQKSDSEDPIELGVETQYTIVVSNAGPSYGTNLVVTDTFPSAGTTPTALFSYQGGLATTPAAVSCTEPATGATTGTLTCNFAGVEPGNPVTIRYRMRAEALTVAGAYSGTQANHVSVKVDETETQAANNVADEFTTARRVAVSTDIGVDKALTSGSMVPGATVAYTVTATNRGPLPSRGAQIIDTLPSGLTLVSAPGCAANGTTLTCALGNLAVNASVSFVVTMQVPGSYAGPDPVVNVATVDAPGDTNPSNDRASVSTPLQASQTDLAVSKAASVNPLNIGQTTVYTLSVTNNGPSPATSVVLTDQFPPTGASPTATLSYQGSLTVNQGGSCGTQPAVGATTGTLVCTFPALASGVTAVVTYAMRAETVTTAGAMSGTSQNQASVTGAQNDPNLGNNTTTLLTTVNRESIATDLAITKSLTGSLRAGQEADYIVTVTNNGPLESRGAIVTDVLPAGLTFVSAADCSHSAGTVTCQVGTLAVSASRSFTIRVRMPQPYTGPGQVTNTATVDAPGDTAPANNSATATNNIDTGAIAAVPALAEWLLAMLALMLALVSVRHFRRR